MATTTTTVLCGVCEARHVTKAADHWCPECEEGLCSDCQHHHSASKATRKHKIIAIENYKKIPNCISSISDSCKTHNLKYTNYCKQHDDVCCPACLTTDHQKCSELRLLTDFIDNSKTSAFITILEERIKELLTFIDHGISDRYQNLSTLRQERQNIGDKIREIRSQIDTHLDNLEQRIMTELSEAEKTTHSSVEAVSLQLSDCFRKVKEIENNLVVIKEYGSYLQTFFGSRKLEKDIEKEYLFLKSVSDGENLNQIRLKINMNDKINNLLSDLKSFGSISVETDQETLFYSGKADKQVSVISSLQQQSPQLTSDVKLVLHSKIDLAEEQKPHLINGCAVFPNGSMVFTEYVGDRLIFLHDNGVLYKQIEVSYGPTGVVIIDDGTVVVASLSGIQIINIASENITRNIRSGKHCYGLTFHKGLLLWCEKSKGVQSIQLSGGPTSTLIPQNKLPASSYLTSFGDMIYQTNCDAQTVTCFSSNGEKQWEFKDTSILENPNCVAVDNDGQVYVTSYNENSVVMISKNGRQGKRLLSQEDGLKRPFGIVFDAKKNKILVA